MVYKSNSTLHTRLVAILKLLTFLAAGSFADADWARFDGCV